MKYFLPKPLKNTYMTMQNFISEFCRVCFLKLAGKPRWDLATAGRGGGEHVSGFRVRSRLLARAVPIGWAYRVLSYTHKLEPFSISVFVKPAGEVCRGSNMIQWKSGGNVYCHQKPVYNTAPYKTIGSSNLAKHSWIISNINFNISKMFSFCHGY